MTHFKYKNALFALYAEDLRIFSIILLKFAGLFLMNINGKE
jgi:hypothetical protein